MRVEYELTVKDLLYFQRYHWKHSPTMQRQYRLGFVGSPLLGVALAAILVGAKHPMAWLLVFVTTAAVYALLYQWIVRRCLNSTLSAAIAEGKNRGVLGPHTVELKPEGLREVTEVNDTLHRWQGVERIETDERYLFVYTQALMAHIIPRTAFSTPEEAARFFALAREWHSAGAA